MVSLSFACGEKSPVIPLFGSERIVTFRCALLIIHLLQAVIDRVLPPDLVISNSIPDLECEIKNVLAYSIMLGWIATKISFNIQKKNILIEKKVWLDFDEFRHSYSHNKSF